MLMLRAVKTKLDARTKWQGEAEPATYDLGVAVAAVRALQDAGLQLPNNINLQVVRLLKDDSGERFFCQTGSWFEEQGKCFTKTYIPFDIVFQ
jgi:hypothetical protein